MKIGWKVQPLETLCHDITKDIVDGPFGSNMKRTDYITEGVPVLKIQNIKPFAIELKKMDYVSPAKADELNRHSYRRGDIVMTKLGDPLGVSAIVDDVDDGIIVADLVRIRAQRINTKYLCYHLNSPLTSEFINSMQKGTTRPRVRLSVVRELPIAVPPLVEQQRIVEILDEAFEGIATAKANAEQNLQNARVLFESHLQAVFTQRGDGWVETTLKSLTTKIGSGATPRGGEESYKSEGISLIRSLNVHDLSFKYAKLAFLDDAQADDLSNVEVQRLDVLLNITGASVARCCIVPEDVLPARVNQHVSIIRPIADKLDAEFLHYALISKPYKDQLLQTGSEGGSTRQAITKAQIQDFSVNYPATLGEQRSIVGKLDAMLAETQRLESLYQRKLAALDELKKSLLHRAFSGEL